MSISFFSFFAGVTLTVDLPYRSSCSATPSPSFEFIIFSIHFYLIYLHLLAKAAYTF